MRQSGRESASGGRGRFRHSVRGWRRDLFAHCVEEFDGSPGDHGGAIAVAGEFHVNEAGVLVVIEHTEDGDEIQFALAEHQMLVLAVANVFDVDVADEVGELAIDLTKRRGLGAEDVADVHRQAEPGAGDMFFEDLEFGHVVNEHSRLGLEGELHAAAFGMLGQLQAARNQPVPRLVLGNFRVRCSRPEADAFGVEVGGDVDRAPEEFKADLASFTADKRGVAFPLRVEEVARPVSITTRSCSLSRS